MKNIIKNYLISMIVFMFLFVVSTNADDTKEIPKVSIIVPVYNVEPWLPKCMDSLVNQTLEDIEIICVDDGSPDNCGKILDDYAKKDREKFKRERIKVIHQENQGTSAARNAGLDVASGEYITFVDSDDYVHRKAFEYVYEYAKKDDVDILQFEYKPFRDGEKLSVPESVEVSDSKVISWEDYIDNFLETCWCHLYKKDLIKKYNPRFPVGITLGEDLCFNLSIIPTASKIKIIPTVLYYYRIRKNSTLRSSSPGQVGRSYANIVPYIINFWRENSLINNKNKIKMLNTLIHWIFHCDAYEYSKQILNSLGPDFLDKETFKKYPKKIQRKIRKLEQAAEKQRKMKKAA